MCIVCYSYCYVYLRTCYDVLYPLSTVGVKSFKIEGRLKGPEYVAITTRAYRLAVDAAWQSLHTPQDSPLTEGAEARGGGGQVSELSKSKDITSKQDLEGVRALKKKIASSSSSATSSDRNSGVDEALMRDLRQVFARGQDQDYDGLSAGTYVTCYTHARTRVCDVMSCHVTSCCNM